MQASRVLPPVFFLSAILLMVLFHLFLPGSRWPTVAGRSVGTLLLVAGVLLNIVSARLFAKRGTAIKPFQQSTALVVEGPYRFSRNPMYLGMLLVLIGLGLLLASTIPLLIVPLFLWLISARFVVVEERMLAERFGTAYVEYCRRVRRWL